ncbi:Short transient receptor potential channel 5 [Trichinella britovi]|uniref:Short transient receptor potential channel 5 n=1 Tax=Trichinella britovi TaxID=45882 RepID=A0A0V1CBU5_TRIBR|nr:Short transient receptor potential channel 5 [Trichinella britovi]
MLIPVDNLFHVPQSTVYIRSHLLNLHRKMKDVRDRIKQQAVKEQIQRGLTLHGKDQTVTQNGQSSEKPYCRKGDDARNQQTVLITIVVMDDDTQTSTSAMDAKGKGDARDVFDLIDCGKEDELANRVNKNPAVLDSENVNRFTVAQYAILRKKWKPILKWLPKIEYRLKETILIAVLGSEVKVVAALLRDRRYDGNSELPVLFPDHLTPIMVAAQMGNYKMIKLFVEMGYTVPIPHRAGCICNECEMEKNHKDDVSITLLRLDSYKALCNPATSFQILSLNHSCFVVKWTNAWIDTYNKLKENLRRLPTALILCCQTEEEAAVMLKESQGAPVGSLTAFPRVSVAIDTDQKDFLSDPRCLTVLKKKFKGEWADWNGISNSEKVARIVVHTVGYPITSLVNVLTNGKVFKSYSTPVARFISFATSYVIFLMCLVVFTQYKEKRDLRGAPDNLFKIIIICYVWIFLFSWFTIAWTDVIQLGFRRFLYSWWPFNAFMNSWLEVKHHGQPYAHRVHWDPYHPTLLFEVLFTFASVMSSWRLFYFFQIFRMYGPVVISIGRCVKDILIFMSMFVVIIGSFALGLNYLIEHYKGNVVLRDGKLYEQPTFMTSIESAIRYLYWAWYGYLDPERLEVVVGQFGPDKEETKHYLVQSAAELLSALYYIILVVSLLNLMISIMSNTAAAVLENSEKEWAYVLSQIWMEFFDDCRMIPPPFSLLQLLIHGIVYIFRRLFQRKKYKDVRLSAWNMNYKSEPEESDDKYENLMVELKHRLLGRRALEEKFGKEAIIITGMETLNIYNAI